jgi:hypothetical protein
MKKINLIGIKFTRLEVIEEAKSKWLCRCDCGTNKIVTTNKLRSGRVKSCGCLNIEQRKNRIKKMTQARKKYSPQEASARKIYKNRYSDGDISFEMFLTLSSLNCYYCNSEPNGKYNESFYDARRSKDAKENGFFIYNGLDRINQFKPHTIDNVVVCCKTCNMCKRTMSHDQFINFIEKIYLNIKLKMNLDNM